MIYVNGTPLNVTRFPDNTTQVWKVTQLDIPNTNWVHIVWDFEHEAEILHIAQLKDLLDSKGFRAALRIKYLPYARQDKTISNTATFALHTFANILNGMNFEEIIITDPHSLIAIELIKNSRAEYPVGEVMGVALEMKADLFCYPDKGAVSKYTGGDNVQNEIYDYPCTYGEKVRDQLTGNITHYALKGDVKDKNILIVDDICDGGMTFILLAAELKKAGAVTVNLFVTHGLFTKGVRVLKEAGITKVFSVKGEHFHDKESGHSYRPFSKQ